MSRHSNSRLNKEDEDMSGGTRQILSYCLLYFLLAGILAYPVAAIGQRPSADPVPAKQGTGERTQGEAAEQAESTLVREYKTNEKVADIIFGEAEMTVEEASALGIGGLERRKSTDTVRVQYPKVAMVADEKFSTERTAYVKSIRFLNARGIVNKEVSTLKMIPGERWSSVRVSKGRRYIGVNSVNKYSREVVIDADFAMFDDEGRELWKMKHHLTSIIPSPNGEYVVGIRDAAIGDAPIYVYNAKGLVREIEKDDQSWDVDFSKDGSYFAVKVVTIKRKMDGARRVREYAAHLIVFGSRGNELWRKENIARGEASFASRVKISDDDIITVMTGVGEYKIYSFDKNGELVREQKGNLELLRRFKQR